MNKIRNMLRVRESSSQSMENLIALLAAMVFVILMLSMPVKYSFGKNKEVCNDGTEIGKCSLIKPYYCQNKTLVKNPQMCGCPQTFNLSDGNCVSNYQQEMKTVPLNYIVDGQSGNINLTVYKGFSDYASKIPRSIEYLGKDNEPSRVDFKLKSINDPIQRDALSELVKEIQKITPDKDKQAKIAISIVQNIPYGYANGTISLTGIGSVFYTRYPYEVLFDNHGICGEKSQLLAFLLRELGFGTAIFYNHEENHESVGILCPQKESWHDSGYCFVETSAPAIISDSSLAYVNGIRITSTPQVLKISEGASLSKNLDEYEDAKDMNLIREKISETGGVNYIYILKWESLKKKYGLNRDYNLP